MKNTKKMAIINMDSDYRLFGGNDFRADKLSGAWG